MRYNTINNELFIENRARLKALLDADSLTLVVGAERVPRNGDQYFPFRQQSDFFYLTGIEQENAVLLLFPDCPNPKYREVLFIEAYNAVKATWEGNILTKEDACKVAGLTTVFTFDNYDAVVHECMNYAKKIYLNTNEYIKFNPDIESKQLRLIKQLQAKYPLHEYCRTAPLLEGLRTQKAAIEIDLVSKACEITGKAFDRVLKTVAPGKYEFEIEAEINHEFTINRANGHGYSPIIASGANACILHYTTNNLPLGDGELLLLDFGAEYANYTADLSRTIPVNGTFSPRQRECYDAVLRVFKQAISLYVPGNTIDQINEAVWKMMEAEMIALGLLNTEDISKQAAEAPLYKKYLMHGVAHHIGLDVHDVGSKYTPLMAGMILTCEPGLYIREEGFGIRIENDILITDDGPIDLMKDIPIEADEIESIIKNRKTRINN